MKRNIIIYGNADKTAVGFPTTEAFQRYISSGIFADQNSRYRYTQAKPADVIVLSRDGLAFGHFDVSAIVDPTDEDREAFPPVKKVYLVKSSSSYERPVRLSQLGIAKIQFGKAITESHFKELLALAGDVRPHSAVTLPPKRYCRICWNTNGWRKPSGAALETGGSYVAVNGFGHEEWLFNYEWCINGHKFGFLQPINKHRALFEGHTLDVAIYTKTPERTLLVATIKHVYVPTLAELRIALDHMQAKGWLDQMRADVQAIGGRTNELLTPTPESIVNIRFRPFDVEMQEPMLVFSSDHKTSRMPRYQALLWDDAEIPAQSASKLATRSEFLQLVVSVKLRTMVWAGP